MMVKNKIPKEPSSITVTDSLDSQSCQKLQKILHISWLKSFDKNYDWDHGNIFDMIVSLDGKLF